MHEQPTAALLARLICGSGMQWAEGMETAQLRVRAALQVKVVINDRVDVAIASGADGVHVGQEDMPCAAVRKLVGPDLIIGVSCKTPEQARAAAAAGADYLGVGAGELRAVHV